MSWFRTRGQKIQSVITGSVQEEMSAWLIKSYKVCSVRFKPPLRDGVTPEAGSCCKINPRSAFFKDTPQYEHFTRISTSRASNPSTHTHTEFTVIQPCVDDRDCVITVVLIWHSVQSIHRCVGVFSRPPGWSHVAASGHQQTWAHLLISIYDSNLDLKSWFMCSREWRSHVPFPV